MTANMFSEVVNETQGKLKDHDEWRQRYAGYAKKIQSNIPFIKLVRSSFHEWAPLNVHLNISSAKNNSKNSISFELRYRGQTVAALTGNKDSRHKLYTEGYEKNNKDNFDCDIKLSNVDWDGKEAREFRGFFKTRENGRLVGSSKRKNEEHYLQSLLLTEFSRRKDKRLQHIKPVTIQGIRFPMPTPISASDHKALQYGKRGMGGGIDILTRTGMGGKATYLCIMELKDENHKREPSKDVMKQAVAYATFIRELLRSESGADWWKLFGFVRNVPDPLELYAVCVMPSGSNNDYSFGNIKLNIESDIIKLHYLYFTPENGRLKVNNGNTTLALMG